MITTTSKFTPGPWAVSKLIGVDDLGIVNSYGSAVARIGNLDIANPANAALIAAAPELYAALENLADFCGEVFIKPSENPELIEALRVLAKSGAPA